MTAGAFDPWAMPGGVDPTGLVKGGAAARALHHLTADESNTVMLSAGGNIAVPGCPVARPWCVAIRLPPSPTPTPPSSRSQPPSTGLPTTRGYLTTDAGSHHAIPGMAFASPMKELML